MTTGSIGIALPLTIALAFCVGWAISKRSVDSSLWALCVALWLGVAALLSDTLTGLQRAVWPREAVDWLAIAAACLTVVAAWQHRPVKLGGITLAVGMLLGCLIVCRLLYGSVYLRPGHTASSSLVGIGLAGMMLGVSWHIELARKTERTFAESLFCVACGLAGAATLGMSGSFQYAIIGLQVVLGSVAAWWATGRWPWIGNVVILMLIVLGCAFAELHWATAVVLLAAILLSGCLGLAPALVQLSNRQRMVGLIVATIVVAVCVGWTGQKFLQDLKGNNASHGGYEAYK